MGLTLGTLHAYFHAVLTFDLKLIPLCCLLSFFIHALKTALLHFFLVLDFLFNSLYQL